VPGISAAVSRVLTASTRAALLPMGPVRDAALELAGAAMQVNEAYSEDNLWRAKSARAAREVAEANLDAAWLSLIEAVRAPTGPTPIEATTVPARRRSLSARRPAGPERRDTTRDMKSR
jgi:hypothetical protein